MKMYEIPTYKIHMVRDNVLVVPQRLVNKPGLAADAVRHYIGNVDREHLVVLMVNKQTQLIGINTVSVGSVEETVAHPREIFKPAIESNAAGIILAHNHPTGDVEPSPTDIQLFRVIEKGGEYLQIKLLDAIIVGDGTNQIYSWRRDGDYEP